MRKYFKRSLSLLLSFALMLGFIVIFPPSANAASNEESIYNFCISEMGLNSAAACGVLANIKNESNFNPNAVGDGGTSYGICQWHASRYTNLKNYCSQIGYSYTSLTGQLYFLQHELSGSYSYIYDYLKGVSNNENGAYDAGYTWCYEFERPANKGSVSVTRGNLAKNTYWPVYGGNIPDPFVVDKNYPTTITAKPAATSGKITIYNSNLSAYSHDTRYIDWDDLCTINAVYTNGYCNVTYPSGNSTHTEYAKTSDFIPNGVSPYVWRPDSKMNTYVRSDMSTVFGSISSVDSCTVVGKSGNKLQLIYPLDSGGYKLGWVDVTVIPPSDFPTPMIGYTASSSNIYAHASLDSMGDTYGQIYTGDRCTLTSVSVSGGWIYVTYPLDGGGSKSGYVYLNDFVPDSSRLTHFYETTVTQQTDAYRKSNMATSLGWVSVGDVITVVGKSGNKLQVLYPVDDQYGGGYKIAWIYNTYIKKNLTGISVTSQPSKTTYLESENLSTSGLVITASYDDGSTVNVTGSCSFSGYDSTPGVKTVTVTFNGKQTAFTVNVKSKSPTELSITSLPNKTDYQVGDTPDFNGLTVKAKYDNGTEENVFDYDLQYDDDITSSTGSKDITVKYFYNDTVVSASFKINVIKSNEVYVSAISVNSLPNKTTYKIGESFNSTGLSIKVEYSNGDSEIISTGFELKGFNSFSSGKMTITVSYKTKQTTFSVTVSDEVDENAPLISLNDTSAVLNDSFVVDLSITNNPGITALQVEIEFDEDVLELKKVSHKNLFENISTGGQSLTSPYKISWFSQSSKNETANGIFAQLEFKFKENVTVENTTITICYDEENIFDTEFNNISFQTRNSVVSLNKVKYGDVNDDKTINMKDIVLLQQYLNKYQVTINQEASDIFYDSKINMKDIAVLQQYLNGYDVTLGKPSGVESNDTYTSFVYGSSELGRDLVCHAFTPKQYNDTVLLNFAIHGFEDEYDHDGQVLVDNANKLIEYYKANPDKLGSTRLLIIPSANPDGLIDGYDNDAFGRCNANGIDLNRDFDANYISQSTPRYYTPSAFSASESRALRDLVLEYSPSVVLDIHGWLDETIGDYEIGQIFEEEMDLQHYVGFTNYNARGYFANWAHQQGALGLLVELKSANNVQYEKLVTSINRILNKDYEYSDTDSRFSEFESIECYTLTKDRSDTFKYFDKPYSAASYIDGKTDLVTIFKVYDNGWVKCQYPIVNGYKTAYCKLEAFIDADNLLDEFYEYSVSANTSVYKRSDLGESFGTVYPTDKITVIAETESALQIIYPLDNGGYKMGWIQK